MAARSSSSFCRAPRASNAEQLAERLRAAVAHNPVSHSGLRIPITASFGVGASGTALSGDPQTLIRLADEALYRAKKKGRNRVEWAKELEEETTALGNLVAVVGRPGGG